MSTARHNRRLGEKHMTKLGDILSAFYGFLSKTPKPSDEEVREYFKRCRSAWTSYATKHNLSDASRNLFTAQVKEVWERRMEEKQ